MLEVPPPWTVSRATPPRAVLVALAVLFGLAGCKPAVRPTPAQVEAPHLGPTWFEYRAKTLNIPLEQAVARDQAMAVDLPPAAPDDATWNEAVAVWRAQCSSCHGIDGRSPMGTARKFGSFGMRMGFTMGGDKMRAGLFRRIKQGGEPVNGVPSAMPAYGGLLSNEQIWALVYYIERL